MASLLAEVLDPLREKIAAKRIAISQQVEPRDLRSAPIASCCARCCRT